MKKIFLLIITILSIIAITFNSAYAKEEWITTTATIVEVNAQNDGAYSYGIQYKALPYTNIEGKTVNEPIVQYALAKRKPIEGQHIKLQYMRDEPVFFKLLGSIKFQ